MHVKLLPVERLRELRDTPMTLDEICTINEQQCG